ncbi:MAG: hypothetical protein H7831_16345 [Magnetococcus sp. WYHC-3]
MSKRFSDTAIWSKPWFREMAPLEKVAWFYILANCDAVGVWDADLKLAEFCIGGPVNWDGLRKSANGNIEVLKNGKWFLPDFVSFQYGELKEECRPHAHYLSLLEHHGLKERVSKGYPKGIHTLKEKEKEIELEKEEEKEPVQKYAEGVKMKSVEYSALAGQYGKEVVDLAIQKVSAQQIKTGKAYKNAKGAILQWGIRAAMEDMKKAGVKPKREEKPTLCPDCGKPCEREFGYWVCKTHGRKEELG